jgi:predicted house-cleaning noncanonical NTP pyrophosphatase (MazG superfamily)
LVKIYDKAIRDRIPEIITESGVECEIKILSDSEFLIKLENKLIEEINEYMETKSIEELADLLEVIYRISELKDVSREELEKRRKEKRTKNGGFEKNLLLKQTSR